MRRITAHTVYKLSFYLLPVNKYNNQPKHFIRSNEKDRSVYIMAMCIGNLITNTINERQQKKKKEKETKTTTTHNTQT